MKMDRNSKVFIDFISLELEVPTICLVTGGVSVRRDRRYFIFIIFGNRARTSSSVSAIVNDTSLSEG